MPFFVVVTPLVCGVESIQSKVEMSLGFLIAMITLGTTRGFKPPQCCFGYRVGQGLSNDFSKCSLSFTSSLFPCTLERFFPHTLVSLSAVDCIHLLLSVCQPGWRERQELACWQGRRRGKVLLFCFSLSRTSVFQFPKQDLLNDPAFLPRGWRSLTIQAQDVFMPLSQVQKIF